MSPPLLWLLLFAILALGSFFMLLSVVPLFADATGSGMVGAGLTTGVMMASTVVTELFTAGLFSRFGQRRVIAVGVLLLTLPTLLLLASSALPMILAVSVLRGAGLAIIVVAGTAIASAIGTNGRQGEIVGIYGVASAIPGIFALPLGLWLVGQFDFTTAIIGATVLGLASMVAVPFLRAHPSEAGLSRNPLALLRTRAIIRPTIAFTSTTLALGVAATFLPLATEALLGIAAVALLAQGIATTLARWLAGRLSDRYGSRPFLVPAMLLASAGIAVLFFVDSPAAILVGMAVFGLGLGAVQNLSLTLMLENTSPGDFARVSVLWNIAFDAGMGIGSVFFGYLAIATGYPWGFVILAAIMAVTVLPSRRKAVR